MARGIRHSAAQRRRLVTAYRASGLSQIQFSKAQGISTTTLGRWLREIPEPPAFVEGVSAEGRSQKRRHLVLADRQLHAQRGRPLALPQRRAAKAGRLAGQPSPGARARGLAHTATIRGALTAAAWVRRRDTSVCAYLMNPVYVQLATA